MVDANILAAYLSSKTTNSLAVHERSAIIIDAVIKHKWPSIELSTPSFCLAETQCVLDKHRYCDWHGRSKDTKHRLTKREYQQTSAHLFDLVEQRRLRRIELDPAHIVAASLASIVNSYYQIRRKSRSKVTKKVNKRRVKPPMGAADCLLLGMAIDLGLRVGVSDVVVVTADRRLADVAARCRALANDAAQKLGLDEVSARLGVEWSSSLYPPCILIGSATEADLADALGGWPLPSRDIRGKLVAELKTVDQRRLFDLGQDIKSESGVGPDSLPYSPQLDDLQMRFARATGIYLTKAEIAKQLLAWRKNPKSRP